MWRNAFIGGHILGMGAVASGSIAYLLRDEFTSDRAAGSVNGTAAEPGPGVRSVVDGNNKLGIVGGEAVFNTGGVGFGNPGLWYESHIRTVGRMLKSKIRISAGVSADTMFGLDSNQTSTPAIHAWYFTTAGLRVVNNSANITVGAFAFNAIHDVFISERSTGAAFFAQVAGASYPLLYWIDATGTATSLFPGGTGIQNIVSALRSVRIPDLLWLPTPLASDGFGSSFGTTDGLGHAEGVAGGIGSGGGGIAWTQQVGTWANSSGKAVASALSGGYAAATVPTSTANVLALLKVTRTAGQGGLILRWTDSSNYLYAEHDGTNAYLKQVLAGTTTTLITAAATYSAGANIVVDVNGTTGRLYWNNALVGSTTSINSSLTATVHGIRSTDGTGLLVQLDDFCVYAKGAEGQYNTLNQY